MLNTEVHALSRITDQSPRIVSAHRIGGDAEAIEVAQALAAEFALGAADRDRDRVLPWPEIERFSASGLGGITVPREYGGAEVSYATLVRVFQILSAADPSLGQIPQNHFGFLSLIRLVGSAQQQHRYFTGVLEGRRLGNAGPERGTKNTADVSARVTARTPARAEVSVSSGSASGSAGLSERPESQPTFVVSGRKFYSTGALFAHWIPVKVQNEAGQMVVVVLERGSAGLTIVDDWSGFGQRTTASGTVVIEDVEVNADDILPAWQAANRHTIQGAVSQIIQAAIDAGIAQAAIADTVKFLRERARPWVDAGVERATQDPFVVGEVGRLYIDLHAAEEVLVRAASVLDELNKELLTPGQELDADDAARASIAVARAKALTTEIALTASEKLFELSGARASLAEFGLDRHWRNARVHTLHDPVRWKYHAIGNRLLNGIAPKRHFWI